MLLAPALWNGYPLLQWDTGGYLARWYEGYLVPSRSTAFGLYLHFGEDSSFWINLGIQALATLWILQLTLRVLGIAQPLRLLAHQPRADPDHRAALACQHAADRHLRRPVGAGALHPGRAWRARPRHRKNACCSASTAFAAATHSATLAVLLGLCCVGWIARPFLRGRISVCRTDAGQPHARRRRGDCCCRRISHCRDNWRGRPAATASPSDGCCRMASSRSTCAIIVRSRSLKLCPYRDRLPATADQFLWGNSMFNTLGRFKGLNDEMGFIVLRSLAEYPAWQAEAALTGNGAATGPCRHRRRHRWLDRPHLRHHRALSSGAGEADARGAAAALAFRLHRDQPDSRSRRAGVDAAGRNPVRPRRCCAGRSTISPCSPARSTLAVLGNAFICAVISGPHDRYGARMAWIATTVVLIAAITAFHRRRTHARPLTAAVTGSR